MKSRGSFSEQYSQKKTQIHVTSIVPTRVLHVIYDVTNVTVNVTSKPKSKSRDSVIAPIAVYSDLEMPPMASHAPRIQTDGPLKI